MSDGSRAYRHQILNESGIVPFLPRVSSEEDLLQSAEFNPYEESSTALFPVGTLLKEGRDEWLYLKNAAVTLGIAAPIQSAARIHAELDDDIVVGAISAIGAYTVTLTSTANLAASPLSTKDGFAEGYLIVNDAAGEGQLYKIKSHEAASGTSTFVVTLYDPLTVGLTALSEVGLVQNPAMNVIVTPAPLTGKFMGVPLIAVTASYYFWSKVKGYAPIIANAAIAVGQLVAVGITAAKANPMAVSTTYGVTAGTYPIGIAVTPGVADTEKFIVDLF